MTTIAGTGESGGLEPGARAIQSPVGFPDGIAVDSSGRVHFPDRLTHRVYMVNAAGTLEVVAGTGELGPRGDGGPATDAGLGSPAGVAISETGVLYIASRGSGLIRKVGKDGIITTIAGSGDSGFNGDGTPARDFRLRYPSRVSAYYDRTVFVVDSLNHRIRVLTVEVPPPAITSVLNGASYAQAIAPASVAVIQGIDLSSGGSPANELPQSVPLPTSLLDTSVIVAGGAESVSVRWEAGLYSVSPTEIRFQMPGGTAPGQVSVTVHHQGALSEPVAVQVSSVGPGLFSANGDGTGVAAAAAVRVARDGTRTPLEVARYDPEQKRYVAVPLDVRADSSPIYLTLFGTGIRSSERPPSVTVRGRHVVVESSGPTADSCSRVVTSVAKS